jgi:hypothetical protein
VTVPLGDPTAVDPGALTVTVAVKVALCPETIGPGDVAMEILVPACWTVCVTPAETGLGLKFASPLVYAAVIV